MSFEPLSFLLERLFDLLKHEATILLVDEKEEIQSLQRELQLIESYLKDIDEIERQATLNHVLQTKVEHFIQILPEIEDFLDQLIDQKLQQAQKEKKKKNRFKSFFSPASNPLIRKHRLANRVAEIREKLRETLQRPEGYHLPNNSHQVTYQRKRLLTSPIITRDEIIVGLEEDANTLVDKFLGKDGEHGANSTIVGMGGSGKTTLAKLFYNHEKIKEAFRSRRAWVCVSQEWNAHDLLLQICAMLGVTLLEAEKSIPDIKLQEFLEEGGSCLVVLDDVWEKNALQELLPSLLAGNGRVLITTRKEKIVMFPRFGAFYVHRARRLTPEQSWELFSRIVGNGFEGSVNFEEDGDYEKLGREMLEKCDGLPLAIVALAGLLGTKSTIQKWENIKDRVVSNILGDDSEAVEKVLELSYSDLPYYLKTCFLYLGSFKEDREIRVDDLIDLWISEGFVKPDQYHESQGLEEVARNYLEELVQRCVIQATKRDYGGDLIKVRIHDLIRDLCINKADKRDFFKVLSWSPTTTTTTYIKPSSYRAIIYQDFQLEVYDRKSSLVLNNPRLRTLIYIRDTSRGGSSPSIKELFPFETFKQLRVLCLQGVALDDSANHIGNMVLLRCLRLRGFRFEREHVYFIKKLRNLETLVMDNRFEWYMTSFDPSRISMLPENMVGSMDQLRVLELYLLNEGDRSAAISGVANLMKLQRLAQSPVCEELVKELQASNKECLRALTLCRIGTQQRVDALCVCVSNNLPNLETLNLQVCGDELGFDQRKMKWGSCRALKELVLDGKILIIKQQESWLCPPKLLSLELVESQIEEEEDMVKFIAPLDHLRQLYLLSNTYYGNTLNMVGFPQLQELTLKGLTKLKEWRITQDALPKLQHLNIVSCRELERIPDGICNIQTLQLLHVGWMPKEFYKRLEKREDGASEGGEDFHLVQHIPTITISDHY